MITLVAAAVAACDDRRYQSPEPDPAADCRACSPTDEICDGRDNDCNGLVDEGLTNTCGGCGPVEHQGRPDCPERACITSSRTICSGNNACGGEGELAWPPGATCGTCGVAMCDGRGGVECFVDEDCPPRCSDPSPAVDCPCADEPICVDDFWVCPTTECTKTIELPREPIAKRGIHAPLAVEDLDQDGVPDVISHRYHNLAFVEWGTRVFDEPVWWTRYYGPTTVSAADIDNDCDVDLVFSMRDGAVYGLPGPITHERADHCLDRSELITCEEAPLLESIPIAPGETQALCDLTGDGVDNLITLDTAGTLSVYPSPLNLGIPTPDPIAQWPALRPPPEPFIYHLHCMPDTDGDGIEEIFIDDVADYDPERCATLYSGRALVGSDAVAPLAVLCDLEWTRVQAKTPHFVIRYPPDHSVALGLEITNSGVTWTRAVAGFGRPSNHFLWDLDSNGHVDAVVAVREELRIFLGDGTPLARAYDHADIVTEGGAGAILLGERDGVLTLFLASNQYDAVDLAALESLVRESVDE